jgi:type IV pilus assembly protein PilY1
MLINLLKFAGRVLSGAMLIFICTTFSNALAASTDLSDVPMAVKNQVTPNVLVIYDNSQSMDAFMGGALVSGDNALTRGNIGRSVMRDAITTYRSKFNWGLMSYELSGNPNLYNTYVYYMGSDTGMVFTDDCTINDANFNQVGTTTGGKPCVVNTQAGAATGEHYLTFDLSSDASNILDALYINSSFSQGWATSPGTGTQYNIYQTKPIGGGWANFTNCVSGLCPGTFTATDAGFLPANPPYTRQYYLPRGKGYYADITGKGTLLEAASADSATHYNRLMSLLAAETLDTATGELKNAAVYTPLRGALTSAKSYFSGDSSPITASCQKNFTMLVTDGLPTGTISGALYSNAERTDTTDADGNVVTWGTAAQDAFDAVTSLKTTTKGLRDYDIPTYVVALGDTVNNTSALKVMNKMADLGGTVTAKLATDSASFSAAIDAISQDILSKDGAAAAVTVSNPNIVVGGVNASYNSSYNSGSWTGELNAYPVSIVDGSIDTNSPIWANGAQAQLDTKTAGSYSSTTRSIVSYSGTGSTDATGSGGIQFQPSSTPASAQIVTTLTGDQEAVFNSPSTPPGPSDAAAVIQYLRGDRSAETSTYRSRGHVLGDIVDAEPLIVQAPTRNYIDDCYASTVINVCAQSFKDAQGSRTSVLFQPANDGMVHAFVASTGAESWAYIPKLIWPSLVNRTKKSGFTHQYYIDATPVAGDVDFKNTDGGSTYYASPTWRTLLVGGLGKGGRGYYALDVTTPTAGSEVDAASKVLWEFPNSTTSATDSDNMGYSYGRPILVKTLAKGWVVIVPSGYNNTTGTGTGHGYLYVLNPRNGAVIKVIDTGVGSTSTPAGLAKLSPYIDNADLDATVSYVYGGDLLGNVWRFDFTGNTVSSWGVTKLTTLVDGASPANPQPVTTEPELADITIAGTHYHFVYVGTGQYLGDTDIATTRTQTMYGLIDDLSNSPSISRANLQVQTMTADPLDSSKRNVTNNAATYSGGSAKKGWYLDLSLTPGERIVTDPQLALGVLAFTSNIPSSTQCVPGGSSWFYTIDYQTGGLIANSPVSYSGTSLGNALASRPTLIKLPSGAVKAIIRLSDVTTQAAPLNNPPSATSGRRVAWKEIVTN